MIDRLTTATEVSHYSPMVYSDSATPRAKERLGKDKNSAHYYKLIKQALHRIDPNFRLHMSGTQLRILTGVYTIFQINDVSEAIQLSNIYHLLKVMEKDFDGFIAYLRNQGIPTLVQAINTGGTPPFDEDDFWLEGFNP